MSQDTTLPPPCGWPTMLELFIEASATLIRQAQAAECNEHNYEQLLSAVQRVTDYGQQGLSALTKQARAAIAAQAQPPGFSPMWFAPIDGTPVMLYMPTTTNKFAVGQWHGSHDSIIGNWGDDEGNYFTHTPVSFMALSNLERIANPQATAEDSSVHQQAQQAQGVPADAALSIVRRFERMVGDYNCLFTEYQGKTMPADVYQRFAALREERIPTARKELADLLAAAPQAESVQADLTRRLAEAIEELGLDAAVRSGELRRTTVRIHALLIECMNAIAARAQQAQGVPAQCAHALKRIAEHRMSLYGNDDFFYLQRIAREALAAAPQAEPQPERGPLSEAAREQLWQQHWPHGQGWGGKEWHRQGMEDAEQAHGIGTKGGDK